MKKGLLLLVAAATTTILVSCGGGNEAEAAKAYCDCYSKVAELQENMTNTDEMMELSEESKKATKCEEAWRKKYDGKIDLEKFKEEVKKEDEKVYKLADELGVF